MKFCKWELDVLESIEKTYLKDEDGAGPSRVIVLYHRNDGIIDFEKASLQSRLNMNSSHIMSYELKTNLVDPQNNHMFQLNKYDADWDPISRMIRDALEMLQSEL